MYYGGRVIGALAVIAMAMAAWFSIRWARADAAFREETPEGIERAVNLAPGHLRYENAAAIQAEYDGHDAGELLAKIAERHPRASAPRLQMGLAAEVRGDVTEAERWLLEAYAVDKMFETRWALANFYFRQGREEDFWEWMRRALEISYGDRRPTFDLCWRASQDGVLILERAMPERAEVVAEYVWFLLDRRQADAVADAARKLAGLGSADEAPLYAGIDALLTTGRFAEAGDVWSAMGHAASAGVTNGDFAAAVVDRGFDWRRVRNMGVTFAPLDAGRGYRVRLSGDEPEQCELLRQWLGGLKVGARYRLRWEARVEGARGVQWSIAGVTAEVVGDGELVFTAGEEAMVLSLVYARPRGEVRAEGVVDLKRVWTE